MTQEITFEKALEKLEKIVADLESGEIALEEALKKYEEGVRLSRLCQGRLADAEKKILILSREADGTLSKEPFESDKTDSSGVKKAPLRRTRSSKEDEEEGGLL